jgi:putative glutathione S-transferase
LYFESEPDYQGRFTVPVLYDTKTKRIVNNESAEIIRMFYTEFDSLLPEEFKAPNVDLLPAKLEKDIDETNSWIYDDVNNGVYKSGFATTQEAYEKAVTQLFKSLRRIEEHLKTSPGPYWYGDHVSEVDVRL